MCFLCGTPSRSRSIRLIKKDSAVYTPAMREEEVFNEVYNLLEAEPAANESNPVESLANVPDIPALRKQLAVLVSTGKAKEAIGVQLTHEQQKVRELCFFLVLTGMQYLLFDHVLFHSLRLLDVVFVCHED